ncbi:MAG: response regulator, partial [Rhodocyclales bacterium]|nr:response regulator [Rhodocyclales bacterium]
IDVVSAPQQGSTFAVRLPLIEAAPPARAAPAAANSGGRLRGIAILAAEDNKMNQMVLAELLGAEGARLICVDNGRQALERVRSDGVQAFDIILMDIQMPEMDGFEATRRLRELAPGLPVVGLTAHALAEERERTLAAGMVAHVTKPVVLDELVVVILQHAAPRHVDDIAAEQRVSSGAESVVPPENGMRFPAELTDPDVIDLRVLASRIKGDPAKMRRLAQMFVDSTHASLQEVDTALSGNDCAALGTIGHRVKSVARTVGAMRFGDLCEQLEAHGLAGRAAEAALVAAELRQVFALVSGRVAEMKGAAI